MNPQADTPSSAAAQRTPRFDLRKFLVRALTGICFVGVLLVGISSPLWYALIFSLITGGLSWEFYTLAQHNDGSQQVCRLSGTLLSLAMFLAVFFYFLTDFSRLPLYLFALLAMLTVLCEVFRRRGNAFQNWAYLTMGQAFVALPMSLSVVLIFRHTAPEGFVPVEFMPAWLLTLLLLIWINDTFAYLTGVTLGRHPMAPHISPKKSVEGLLGGAGFTLLAGALVFPHIPYFDTLSLTVPEWLGLSLTTVVAGTFGDLIESLLKRSVGVKDSGQILPGHGGFLDRFDSLLLALPAAIIYLHFIGH